MKNKKPFGYWVETHEFKKFMQVHYSPEIMEAMKKQGVKFTPLYAEHTEQKPLSDKGE